jgi:hypothetical protein
MKKPGELRWVFVLLGVLLVTGMIVAGCHDRHRRYYWIFTSSLNTLLAEDGLAFSVNGQCVKDGPRCYFKDNGDAIILFLTAPTGTGSPKYVLWASYYMRDRLAVTPPVEIRGERTDYYDDVDVDEAVVMFYKASGPGMEFPYDGVSSFGFRTGDAIILFERRDIDTDTSNTSGDEKGPNYRAYYARFTMANVLNKQENYGFGKWDNAKIIDDDDGDDNSVGYIGVVSDGLRGPARFSGGYDYDQNDFSDYLSAVWTQTIDIDSATNVRTTDTKLLRARFDLSTGEFEAPGEIKPDPAATEYLAGSDDRHTYVTTTFFAYNRSVFFETTDTTPTTDDNVLNWNRLEGSFGTTGAMSADFGDSSGSLSGMNSLRICPTYANRDYLYSLRRNNIYGEDQGISTQFIFYRHRGRDASYSDLMVSRVDPSAAFPTSFPSDASAILDVITPVSGDNQIDDMDFDTRISRDGDYILGAFEQYEDDTTYDQDNDSNDSRLFVRHITTSATGTSVVMQSAVAIDADATGVEMNVFRFQDEMRYVAGGKGAGVQSNNNYVHFIYEQSGTSDSTDVLKVARYDAATNTVLGRGDVVTTNRYDFWSGSSTRNTFRNAFALDDNNGGVIVYYRANSRYTTVATVPDREYRGFAVQFDGSTVGTPVNIGSSATDAVNGLQVRSSGLSGFTSRSTGDYGDFHNIFILEDRENTNYGNMTSTNALRFRRLKKTVAFGPDAFDLPGATGTGTPTAPLIVDTGIFSDVGEPAGTIAGNRIGLYFGHSGHYYYNEFSGVEPTGSWFLNGGITDPYLLDDISPTNFASYWVFNRMRNDNGVLLGDVLPELQGALAFYTKLDPVTQDRRLFLRIRGNQ